MKNPRKPPFRWRRWRSRSAKRREWMYREINRITLKILGGPAGKKLRDNIFAPSIWDRM